MRTFPTGLSMHLQYSTASQTVTESYEDTINHVPDKKSGRGGWERRGALAGLYGTSIYEHCFLIEKLAVLNLTLCCVHNWHVSE